MEFVRTEAGTVAIVDEKLDLGGVLSAIGDAWYNAECRNIAIAKELLPDDFFRLASGVAGEMLQKFSNYRARLAIYGDFSMYGSEPLRAFIRESNRGDTVFFTATREDAIERLLR